MTDQRSGTYVLYLAVLPHYRQACIDELRRRLDGELAIYTGAQHMDSTVTTGIAKDQYVAVTNRFLLRRRLMYQVGHWRAVLDAETAIFDLNPRCLSVWLLTAARLLLRRRTLHWGHLHPRGGQSARTAVLRKALRRISHGTILYSYEQSRLALLELPRTAVWTAANALYPADQLRRESDRNTRRTDVICVGRLVVEKKVGLLVQAFARSHAAADGGRLIIVGDGTEAGPLRAQARSLGIAGQVMFTGSMTSPEELADLYASCFAGVSPGYVGLNLTQSLGFGVPFIASRDEPHSPEIELAEFGHVRYFDTDNAGSLAAEIDRARSDVRQVDPSEVAEPVIRLYTGETMADGIVNAFRGGQASTRTKVGNR